MKKRFLLLSVVLALVLVLAGCSKPTMNVEPQDDGSLSITCDRMYGSGVSADITVADHLRADHGTGNGYQQASGCGK